MDVNKAAKTRPLRADFYVTEIAAPPDLIAGSYADGVPVIQPVSHT